MIFYFSATGNSRWVAEQLSQHTGEELVDMVPFIRQHTVPEIPQHEERVGVVFPIHSWYPPKPVVKLLMKLVVPAGAYRFAVATCGDDAGKALSRLHKRFRLDAAWTVAIPNTYVPMFELDTDEVAHGKIAEARTRTAQIARCVEQKSWAWEVHEGAFPYSKTYVVWPFFEKVVISAKGFSADPTCVACGRCVQVCPMDNVRLVDGRVEWGSNCIHCMACLHACPKEAIQYGKHTQHKGRYRIERFL